MNTNPWFVLVLGMGTVFVGLICLIYLTKLLSLVLSATGKKKLNKGGAASAPVKTEIAPAEAPAAVQNTSAVEDRRRFVAAVSAAIASHLGTDVEGLRIHSITPLIDDSTDADKAAALAAIAVVMRRDPNALRICSMHRV